MADSPRPGSDLGIDAADDVLGNVETGLNALFAVELVEDLLSAIDVDALEAGAPPEEVFDREQLRATMGEPVGRVLAREVAGRAVGGGLAGVLGRELAGRAGAAACRALLEDDGVAALDAPDESTVEGRDAAEPVHIEVEDLDDE